MIKSKHGALVEGQMTENVKSTWTKTCGVSIFAPQIPHGLPWGKTQASAIKPTTVALARLISSPYYTTLIYGIT